MGGGGAGWGVAIEQRTLSQMQLWVCLIRNTVMISSRTKLNKTILFEFSRHDFFSHKPQNFRHEIEVTTETENGGVSEIEEEVENATLHQQKQPSVTKFRYW